MQLEKSRRILVFFLLLLVGFIVFLAVAYFKAVLPCKMPTLIITKADIAVRGIYPIRRIITHSQEAKSSIN